jgi:hypothetical protein
MQPEVEDQAYPLLGKVSTPRMIIAQFDNLNLLRVLIPLRSNVLKQLEEYLNGTNIMPWFTIYVSVFILLHEVAVGSADRFRHGAANSVGVSSPGALAQDSDCPSFGQDSTVLPLIWPCGTNEWRRADKIFPAKLRRGATERCQRDPSSLALLSTGRGPDDDREPQRDVPPGANA